MRNISETFYDPKFKSGSWVKYLEDGQTYRVLASTHSHTQVEGREKAIANWLLIKTRGLTRR